MDFNGLPNKGSKQDYQNGHQSLPHQHEVGMDDVNNSLTGAHASHVPLSFFTELIGKMIHLPAINCATGYNNSVEFGDFPLPLK